MRSIKAKRIRKLLKSKLGDKFTKRIYRKFKKEASPIHLPIENVY